MLPIWKLDKNWTVKNPSFLLNYQPTDASSGGKRMGKVTGACDRRYEFSSAANSCPQSRRSGCKERESGYLADSRTLSLCIQVVSEDGAWLLDESRRAERSRRLGRGEVRLR